MDFNEALAADTAWKVKLAAYVRDPDFSLLPSTAAYDKACDLGKWIHGEDQLTYEEEGTPHGQDRRQHLELKTSHAVFHLAVAEVVRRVNRGEEVSEEGLLGPGSVYDRASSDLVRCTVHVAAQALG